MVDILGKRAPVSCAAARTVQGSDLSMLLPASLLAAVGRGFLGRCPKCACARLFRSFLQPVASCPACGQDWRKRTADDFPPYLVILAIGHIVAPGMIAMERGWHPPLWVHLTVWLPAVLILGIFLIQPMKGAVIAAQWWHWDRAGVAEYESSEEAMSAGDTSRKA